MSILIKGMEMPEGCFGCILSFMWFNGTETVLQCNVLNKLVSDDGTKDTNCPLIEVPPHGDLIDKDSTMNEILEERGLDTACWFAGIVNDMPTVIPADKDGET